MAKYAPDAMMDASLDYVALSTLMIACSAQPTNYTEATITFALADVLMAGGDFTVGDGHTNGRMVTVGAKNAVNIDATGEATHIALVTTTGTTLRYVTTCDPHTITAGQTLNFPAWDIAIADPV